MVAATQSRQRTESPERWAKALSRAIAANLAYIELVGGDGAWAVSSQRDSERGYVATTHTCTCEAGRSGDPVCCHRALVRVLTGYGEPALEPAPQKCPSCTAGKVEEWGVSGPIGFKVCAVCGGAGELPARRLDDLSWDDLPPYRELSPEEQRATGHARRQPVAAA